MEWTGNENVFRTYIKGSGKRSAEKHKGGEFCRTWEDASQFNSFGAELVPGVVDISFDSKEMYKAFLDMADANEWKCLALPSPHGGHTYWRKPDRWDSKDGKDKPLAVGFLGDIHSGATYIPLRVDGEDRFPPDINHGDIDEVPNELIPIKTTQKLWGLNDGDGRNDTLFKYILDLQRAKFSKREIKSIMANTNDFVLGESMDANELNVILRDEAFSQETNIAASGGGNKGPDYEKLANQLIERCGARVIDGQLYIYDGCVYKHDPVGMERLIIKMCPGFTLNRRKELLRYTRLLAPEITRGPTELIAFKNGILNLKTMTMEPFDKRFVVTNLIPHNFNPNAYDETTDRVMTNLSNGDDEIRELLLEAIGYCLWRRNELGICFISTGDKANGKSTFITMLRTVLGADNCTSLDLKDLGDRFSTASLDGTLANLGDDIGDAWIPADEVAVFKKIVTGNEVKAEWKGQDVFFFRPYTKLFFSANTVPRMDDRTGAVKRRLIIIPFQRTFTKSDPDYDPYIIDKITTENACEYVLSMAIPRLTRVLSNREFSHCVAAEHEMAAYQKRNSSVLQWLEESGETRDTFIGQSSDKMYSVYKRWCTSSGLDTKSAPQFGREINKVFGVESYSTTIAGRRMRLYRDVKTP